MVYGMYAICDEKTGFMSPTCDMNDNSAIRNFRNAMSRSDSLFAFAPADFRLYCIGSYDTDTGMLIGQDPKLIFDGKQVIKSE